LLFLKIVNLLFWLLFGVNGFVRNETVAQIITCFCATASGVSTRILKGAVEFGA